MHDKGLKRCAAASKKVSENVLELALTKQRPMRKHYKRNFCALSRLHPIRPLSLIAPLAVLDSVGPDIKDRQTLLRQLRIEMETCKVLTLLLACVVLMASASPRIRSGRDPKDPETQENNRSRNFVSCYQSIPCGWALYTTERRQPFRRISTYTRNRL